MSEPRKPLPATAMDHETVIRLSASSLTFIAFALLERAKPRRRPHHATGRRWFNNLTIALLDAACVRLFIPLLPVGAALLAQEGGWGLFNTLPVRRLPAVAASVAVLDATIYLQHRAFHRYSPLWRLHLVHHLDLDLDVTSGVRFHPVEIFVSLVIKVAAVFLLGAPPLAVLVFEILLNGASLFNHSNLFIPLALDRLVRLLVVTPDMHRVHHSVIPEETGSNFGFTLSWWDRIAGTYRAQPVKGHDGMQIGCPLYPDDREQSLLSLLTLPFRRQTR